MGTVPDAVRIYQIYIHPDGQTGLLVCYTLHGQKQNPSLKALSLNWKTWHNCDPAEPGFCPMLLQALPMESKEQRVASPASCRV